MKVVWATDIHLNFVGKAEVEYLCRRVRDSGTEAVLLGGDIAEALDIEEWLGFLASRVEVPIYFVLGNHDYYGGDVAAVRARMTRLASPRLHWLPASGVVELTPRTGLIGHGGWGDGRIGDFLSSEVILTDYVAIRDLREVGTAGAEVENPLAGWENKSALKKKLGELGDEAAATLRPLLAEAVERFQRVIVLTHVPPFREACWHGGAISEEPWLPGFTCKAMGDLLLDVVGRVPTTNVTVLCGHTHGDGEYEALPNLLVRTRGAKYTKPDFEVMDID